MMASGNIRQISDGLTSETQAFGYDELDRLRSATVTGGPAPDSEGYTYDPTTGNLQSKGSPSDTYAYQATAQDCRVLGPNGNLITGERPIAHAVSGYKGNVYGYDCNGNMITRTIVSGPLAGDYSLTYDAENRLVSASGPNGFTALFVYNGDGQRVQSTIDGVTTTFVGNYYEVTGGTATKYYYAGSARIAMRTGTSLYYLLADHLGSTSITTDAVGEKVSEMRYTPWGEVRYAWKDASLNTTPAYDLTRWTFNGQYSYSDDPSTEGVEDFGLLYFNARWVDPQLGRFSQADTVVPDEGKNLNLFLIVDYHEAAFLYRQNQYNAGSKANMAAGQILSDSRPQVNELAFDRYSYSQNDPVRHVDSSGHCIWDLCILEIGFVGVGVLELAAAAGVASFAIYTYSPEGEQRIQYLTNSLVTAGEQAAEGLASFVKGEYVPPGLNTGQRETHRDAIHKYKDNWGIPPNVDVPKEILDQIADAIKNGASAIDAVDNAPEPPEPDLEEED